MGSPPGFSGKASILRSSRRFNKAASDSSYHVGSRRGGYGYGLAAALVSVKGEDRSQRFAATQELWKWIRCARERAWDRTPLSRLRPAACGAARWRGICG